MNVVDRLAAVVAAIHDATIPLVGHAQVRGQPRGYRDQSTHDGLVVVGKIDQGAEVPFGYYEDVNRRLWIDVAKRQDLVVAVHLFARNRAGDDRTEETLIHHDPFWLTRRRGSRKVPMQRSTGRSRAASYDAVK